MATRPKRLCTEQTRERIAKILEWENCSESSALFKNAAAKMEREFRLGVAEPESVKDEDSSDEAIVIAEVPTASRVTDDPAEAIVIADDPAETDEKNHISTHSEGVA
jgi:hypothetical protein